MGKLPIRAGLVFCLFLLSAIAFLDRTNISIAGPQISREFGLGNVRLGWVFSAFLVGYAASQVLAGWIAVTAWAEARSRAGSLVVGCVHTRHCAGFSEDERRPVDPDRCPFRAWSW